MQEADAGERYYNIRMDQQGGFAGCDGYDRKKGKKREIVFAPEREAVSGGAVEGSFAKRAFEKV